MEQPTPDWKRESAMPARGVSANGFERPCQNGQNSRCMCWFAFDAVPGEIKPTISRAWPYGVKEERLRGEYCSPNPTAAGLGYCPVPLFF